MTQYIGQVTVIIEAEDETIAESKLRAVARQIEEADEVVFADHNGDVEDYEAIDAECQKSLESGPALPGATAPRLLEALRDLAEQADEDCPAEYRSRHFTEALEQANTVIAQATGRAA